MNKKGPGGESKTIDQSSHGLNYKILGIIAALVVAYQVGLFLTEDDPGFNITDITYLAGVLICGIIAIFVATRYRGSKMLGKAYLLLGLGFLSWFAADVAFYYYEYVLEIDPYPSPFDIGFIASYVFAIFHLSLNSRYFKPQWSIPVKILLIAIPVITAVSYSAIILQQSDYEEMLFDLFLGNVFVIGGSTTLAFAILGASVFRHSVLKEVWLLLVIGIFLWMLADVWYYYMEIFDAYYSSHPVNTVWIASFLLIIYALYKHHKAI